MAVFIDAATLAEVPLPCILHWKESHFVVLYQITDDHYYVSDPIGLRIRYTKEEFLSHWLNKENPEKSAALLLVPNEEFNNATTKRNPKVRLKALFKHLKPYKKYEALLVLGLLLGSLIQFTLPFLTQMLVDTGINFKDPDFLVTILAAQFALVGSKIVFDFCRDYLLVNISLRLNVQIVHDFLARLLLLPLSFYNSRITGDVMRRIEDNGRVEKLLSSSSLNFIFSIFTFLIFGIILGIYNPFILLLYLSFSIAYVIYVSLFLKKRAIYDVKKFYELTRNQNLLLQIIEGIAEIKLNNSEEYKRHEWSAVQDKIFDIRLASARLVQIQDAGAFILNEGRNIIILYISAKLVISGSITLGVMLSIQYMIGFLNQAITQSIFFIREAQDAKISLERIMELQQLDSENDRPNLQPLLQHKQSLQIENLQFRYEGPASPAVLNGINLHVNYGKIIAIVGSSGSGKTTLLKLLLNFYTPTGGNIRYGQQLLHEITPADWRKKCGVVMQDGFIFTDTIAKNVALSDKEIHPEKLKKALRIANIDSDIDALPLKEHSIIGIDGIGLSQGQKQRLLIARAVYKDPDFIFFDEATSSLDANNEKIIMQNLQEFYQHKTVFIIAHRLSTVKNADQILVLEKGKIVESGTHQQLIANKSWYFELVKNQLELDN
jgi:ATP-binding cassette subfamily B protein